MDKRRTDTKERIIKATEYALSQTDYIKLSLRDLAKNCGISAATMYKHFTSKDDLFQQVHDRLASRKLADYLEKTFDSNVSDFKEKILSLAVYILGEFNYDPETMNFIFFSPYAEKSYAMRIDPTAKSRNLLDEYTGYIAGLKKQYHLSEQEDSLFIRLWSFLQGYSLLVSKGITQIDEEIIKQTLKDFTSER